MEHLRSIGEKLNSLTTDVMDHRCKVHSRILGITSDDTSPSIKPQLNSVGAENPNSMSGGGRHNEGKLMSKSASASSSSEKVTKSKMGLMAKSLHSPLAMPCTSPPIARLMQESMMIKSEYVKYWVMLKFEIQFCCIICTIFFFFQDRGYS